MTDPQTDFDEPQTFSERAQTFLDWTRINTRLLTIGAVIIVVAAASFWFYRRSREIQIVNAERAFNAAQQSVSSGNLPLAQSDLQKVVDRYSSTPAGVLAAMQLSQMLYNQGKYADGLKVLQNIERSSAAGPNISEI